MLSTTDRDGTCTIFQRLPTSILLKGHRIRGFRMFWLRSAFPQSPPLICIQVVCFGGQVNTQVQIRRCKRDRFSLYCECLTIWYLTRVGPAKYFILWHAEPQSQKLCILETNVQKLLQIRTVSCQGNIIGVHQAQKPLLNCPPIFHMSSQSLLCFPPALPPDRSGAA